MRTRIEITSSVTELSDTKTAKDVFFFLPSKSNMDVIVLIPKKHESSGKLIGAAKGAEKK